MFACCTLCIRFVIATSTTNCDGCTPITSATAAKNARLKDVVEQMVAIVGPERHLLLAVMHRVQFPPDADPVLQPVIPVAGEIEHHADR